MIRRLTGVVAAAALAVPMSFAAAPSASATFSTNPDTTWMTNGVVYAIVQSGNTIYIGGKFTTVRACPPGTTCPGGVIHAQGIGAIDATTGAGIKTFHPTLAGGKATVYALALLDGKLWIGGSFDTVNGTPRLNIAVLDPTNAALDTTISHQVGLDTTEYVRGMTATSSRVYAAGYFTSIDGIHRPHLAAFDADGSLDPAWRARTKGLARTLTTTCDGRIIAGGNFRSAAGTGESLQARATLAIFDPASGALDPWSPPNADIPNGVNAFDLSSNCTRLFVGYGGSNAIYAFDLTANPGTILWSSKTGGNVQTVFTIGDAVYFGGHFAQVSYVDQQGNAQRIRFAAADLDGNILPWNPSFDGMFFGPWDIYANATQVYVGGAFTTVSGVPQYMFARFTDVP